MNGAAGQFLRILHTMPFVPYPPDSGGKLVPYHHITGLAKRGNKITVVAPLRREGDKEAVRALGTWAHIVPVPSPPVSHLQILLRFVMNGESIRTARHRLVPVEHALRKTLRQNRYDAIILDSLFTSYLIPAIRREDPHVPIFLIEHNVESLLFRRYLSRKSALVRLLGSLETRRILGVERRAVSRVREAFVLSCSDRKNLLKLAPNASVTVLPPGTDTHPGEVIPDPSDPKSILFLGNYRWEPNCDAARWLIREIFPRIRAKKRDVKLILAGEDPYRNIQPLENLEEEIHVLGRIEDSKETVRACGPFLVPLLVGGGVRLKILEALANERPVVTTSLGCEGIPVEHGRHLLIADSAESFAESVLSLLDAPDRAKELAKEGRALVEREFDWERIVEMLDSFLRRSIASVVSQR